MTRLDGKKTLKFTGRMIAAMLLMLLALFFLIQIFTVIVLWLADKPV
ncbi:hypothetical protein ACM1RC_04135 [Paenibacillus azoreducens]